MLIGVLRDLRRALDDLTQSGAGTEVERQRAAAFERLRGELSEAWSRHFELGQQHLEQRQATSLDLAQRFDELRELLSARQESLDNLRQPGHAQPAVSLSGRPAGAASPAAAHVEELSATLEDLRDSILEMDSFLQRLAQKLRSQTGEPVVVKVEMMPGASSRTSDG
jgi:hypothetical protein